MLADMLTKGLSGAVFKTLREMAGIVLFPPVSLYEWEGVLRETRHSSRNCARTLMTQSLCITSFGSRYFSYGNY